MPKKKTPELTPAEQLRRFKDAAKAAGVTNNENEFESAFKRIVPDPKRSRDQKKK